MTQISFAVTIWDRKISPSASKRANNSEERALISVLDCDCEAPRNLSRARLRTPKIPDEVPKAVVTLHPYLADILH